MKEFLPANCSLTEKISFYHLLLLLASLPFDRFYSHIILISLAAHTLIHFNNKNIKPLFTLQTLVLTSVLLITVISTAYSINKTAAFNDWGRQVPMLLFPVIFCLNPFDLKKHSDALLLGFSLVCTATVIYLYLDVFHIIRHYHLPVTYLFSAAFINHNFSEPIDMHATFLSMQLAVAMIYIVSLLFKANCTTLKLLYVFCICVLLAGIIQLSSKSVYYCLFILINFAVPYFLLKGKLRLRFILIAGFISLASIISITTVRALRERYFTELKTDLSSAKTGEVSDSRLARWKVVSELISKSPVTGYGAGAEMGLLHNSFFENKLYNSFLHNLNAHNQYLSFLIKAGIWGLLLYLATLYVGFKISFGRKDLMLFTFMLLTAIVSLSENLLDVDKGVFFYAFFFSFFMFSNYSGPEKSISIKAAPILKSEATNSMITTS